MIKTSIEASCLLLRIDDVVSGVKRREKEQKGPSQPEEPMETFGDQRDGWLNDVSKQHIYIILWNLCYINPS